MKMDMRELLDVLQGLTTEHFLLLDNHCDKSCAVGGW